MLCYERLRALDSDRSIQRMSLDNRQTDVYIYMYVSVVVLWETKTREEGILQIPLVWDTQVHCSSYSTHNNTRDRETEKKKEKREEREQKERERINLLVVWYDDLPFPFFLSFILSFFFFSFFFFSPLITDAAKLRRRRRRRFQRQCCNLYAVFLPSFLKVFVLYVR